MSGVQDASPAPVVGGGNYGAPAAGISVPAIMSVPDDSRKTAEMACWDDDDEFDFLNHDCPACRQARAANPDAEDDDEPAF